MTTLLDGLIVTLLLQQWLMLLLLIGISLRWGERATIVMAIGGGCLSLLLLSAVASLSLFSPNHTIEFGSEQHRFYLAVDGLALIYGFFTVTLITLVGVFSRRYLHRESGIQRFYSLMQLLMAGVTLVCFAGSLNTLLIGWEFVGLASVLLIAFFNNRPGPVLNAFHVFVIYRCCDTGLFAAAFFSHGAFQPLNGPPWLGIETIGTAVGLLILPAAMGKSAQFPFSGWLPRAMEGPTPSSAVFYGAVAVHLGPFLLLRSADLIQASPTLALLLILIGTTTAVLGQWVGRVQSDIKSLLAWGSVTQLGLITVEIGLGLWTVALLHVIGHSGFRTLQILRAPNLLHDRHHIESLLGRQAHSSVNHQLDRRYRYALEGAHQYYLLNAKLVNGFLAPVRFLDRMEHRWSTWLAGKHRGTSR